MVKKLRVEADAMRIKVLERQGRRIALDGESDFSFRRADGWQEAVRAGGRFVFGAHGSLGAETLEALWHEERIDIQVLRRRSWVKIEDWREFFNE